MPGDVRPPVLVIDDHPSVRALVCDCLTGLGCDSDEAEDGSKGLALFERRRYDLVVTDLKMPGMSGWDVVEVVRQRAPATPIIMISGFASDADVGRSRREGVALLLKPFSVQEFTRVVREALTDRAS